MADFDKNDKFMRLSVADQIFRSCKAYSDEQDKKLADLKQGYSIVANVKRNTLAETTSYGGGWALYGTVGHVEGWTGTENSRNGCRIGDIFMVSGLSSDEGNLHLAFYKSDTDSGVLHGSCMAHVKLDGPAYKFLAADPPSFSDGYSGELTIHKYSASSKGLTEDEESTAEIYDDSNAINGEFDLPYTLTNETLMNIAAGGSRQINVYSDGCANISIPILFDGARGSDGKDGKDGVGVKSVTQTKASADSGGENEVTVELTNGNKSVFKVLNGNASASGTEIVQTGGDATDKVMSQKASTYAISHNTSVIRGCGSIIGVGNCPVYRHITAEQRDRLLKATVMSVRMIADPTMCTTKSGGMWSVRTSDNKYFYYTMVGGGGGDYSYYGNTLEGKNAGKSDLLIQNIGNQAMANADDWTMVIDRTTGTVRTYYGVTHKMAEVQDDRFKQPFVQEDTEWIGFSLANGNLRTCDWAVYDCDYIDALYSYKKAMEEQTNVSTPMAVSDVFDQNINVFGSEWLDFIDVKPCYNSSTTTVTQDASTKWWTYAVTVPAKQNAGGVLYMNIHFHFGLSTADEIKRRQVGQWKVSEREWVIEITEGSFDFTQNIDYALENRTRIYDSGGNLISDVSNLGVGTYTFKVTACSAYSIGWRKLNNNGSEPAKATLVIKSFKVRYCCCVAHSDFCTLYDGGETLDDQSGEFGKFYGKIGGKDPVSMKMLYSPLRSVKQGHVVNVYNGAPQYPGQINVDGDKVYAATENYTWKQINNT